MPLFPGRSGSVVVAPPTQVTTQYPFDAPTGAAHDDSTVITGFHAMATQQRSITDKNIDTDSTSYERVFMEPGGIEAAGQPWQYDWTFCGGPWRLAPKGRNPLGAGYTLTDKNIECAWQRDVGMRHVFVDILGDNTFSHALEWGRAAKSTGMKAIAMPDASVSIVRDGATNLKNYLVQLFSDANATWAKHTDGRWLVIPYGPELAVAGGTEQQIIDYWVSVGQQMAAAGYPIALWTCHTQDWRATKGAPTFTKPALASYVVGVGSWGSRDPVAAVSPGTSNGAAGEGAHSRATYPTMLHLGTTGNEDNRPKDAYYVESGGWDQLVTALTTDIANNGTDALQFATWNDWFEGAGMAPSNYHGFAALDVVAYYMVKKRLGYWPTIVRDTLYLAHRKHQATGTPPTYTVSYPTKMVNNLGQTPLRDIIDVLAFPAADGVVEIYSGGTLLKSQAVTANNPTRVTTPLVAGTISCRMTRAGSVVPFTSITSPWTVGLTTQPVQNLAYMRLTSRR